MTILVVLVGMLAGLAWFLPEDESKAKETVIFTADEYENKNPRT